MIAKIEGKLLQKLPSSIIIKTGGIGFEIFISAKTYQELPDTGSNIELDVYLFVRDNELKLIGFFNLKEKELFLKLLEVSGVSVKIALSAFSIYSVDELVRIIKNRKVELIKRITGIGKKLAERIILELREKLEEDESRMVTSGYFWDDEKILEIKEALKTLGYSSIEISRVLTKVNFDKIKDMKTEDILKIVLKVV